MKTLKTKHTPGPWEVRRQDKRRTKSSSYLWITAPNGNPNGKHITSVDRTDPDPTNGLYCRIASDVDERDANARLISAAPELLDLATHLYQILCETTFPDDQGLYDDIQVEAKRIFAKAEGR